MTKLCLTDTDILLFFNIVSSLVGHLEGVGGPTRPVYVGQHWSTGFSLYRLYTV